MSEASTSSGTFPRGYFTNSVSRKLKYSYGFRLFAFVLFAMLYKGALAFALFTESMMCQECFPTKNDLILRITHPYYSMGTEDPAEHLRYGSWLTE